MIFDSFIADQFSVVIDEFTGQDVYIACLNCGREKKMGVHRDEGLFHCFICGHSGNALQLVQETLGISYQEAISQLKKIYQGQARFSSTAKVSDLLTEMVAMMNGEQESKAGNPKVELPSGCIPIAKTIGSRYLSQRGFERQNYQQYNLKFCAHPNEEDSLYKNHIIFPDYEPDTRKLHYWTTRYASFATPYGGRKKSYNPSGVPRRGILYGLFAIPTALRSIILVEGPLDVLALSRRAVAIMSNQVTELQAQILAKRFKEVIICLDRDAVEYALKMAKRLKDIGVEKVSISIIPYEDPAEAAKQGRNVYWEVEEYTKPYSMELELTLKVGGR